MQDYLKAISGFIGNKRLNQQIMPEMSDHIKEKTALYVERGFDEEAAWEKANADMGEDAETVAAQLRAMQRSYRRIDFILYACSLLYFAFCFLSRAFSLVLLDFSFFGRVGVYLPRFGFDFFVFVLGPIALMLLSARRRWVLPPLWSAAVLLTGGDATLSYYVLLAELVSGNIRRYAAFAGTFEIFCDNPLLQGLNFGVQLLLALCCVLIACISFRFRRNRAKKTDRKIKSAVCAVPVFCMVFFALLTCLSLVCRFNASPAAFGLEDYPNVDQVYIQFAETQAELDRHAITGEEKAPEAAPGALPHLQILCHLDSVFSHDVWTRIADGAVPYTENTVVKTPSEDVFDHIDRYSRLDSEYRPMDRYFSYLLSRRSVSVPYAPFCRVYYLKGGSSISECEVIDAQTYTLSPGDEVTVCACFFSMTDEKWTILLGNENEG